MFNDAFPIISTPDLRRALGFYRDLLDGQVEYRFPPEGDPGYVGLRIGGVHLGIAYVRTPGPMTVPSGSRCGSTPISALAAR